MPFLMLNYAVVPKSNFSVSGRKPWTIVTLFFLRTNNSSLEGAMKLKFAPFCSLTCPNVSVIQRFHCTSCTCIFIVADHSPPLQDPLQVPHDLLPAIHAATVHRHHRLRGRQHPTLLVCHCVCACVCVCVCVCVCETVWEVYNNVFIHSRDRRILCANHCHCDAHQW